MFIQNGSNEAVPSLCDMYLGSCVSVRYIIILTRMVMTVGQQVYVQSLCVFPDPK